ANYEAGGLSSNSEKVAFERSKVLTELLHPLMLSDYLLLNSIRTPLLESLPELSETTRIDSYVTRLVRAILKIRRSFKYLMKYDS
ncbi:MAG: hypothetical protein ACRC8J_10200, partial [Phocaeicola sp.]